MKTTVRIVFIAFLTGSALGLAGCATHTYEKTTETRTILSEEPVLGQPAPSLSKP